MMAAEGTSNIYIIAFPEIEVNFFANSVEIVDFSLLDTISGSNALNSVKIKVPSEAVAQSLDRLVMLR